MPSYYSPLYNNVFPLNTTKTPLDRVLATMFRGVSKRAALMKALNGAAAGGTAMASRKRVVASTVENGGVRAIETYNLVNRATTSADETYIDGLLDPTSRIATPTNKAGNFPA